MQMLNTVENYTPDCIATMSGGIDSVVLAHILKDEGRKPLYVYIDYGTQGRDGEIRAAINSCKKLGVPLMCMDFSIYKELTKAYILGNTKEFEKGTQMWLEGRNGLIGFILAIMASSMKLTQVFMGSNADDYDELYLDTDQRFYDALNNLIHTSFRFKVTVSAPLLERNMIKGDVIKKGIELGVDFVTETHSCSSSGETCCDYEHCESCKERKAEFDALGLKDPFLKERD